jgi:glutamate synthase (NADPH/NADH) large chain
VVNFFFFIAEQMRQQMAKLGFRTVDEMVGRVEKIDAAVADAHWKAKGIDLSSILYSPDAALARGSPQGSGAGSRARNGARSQADCQGSGPGAQIEDQGGWQLCHPQRAPHRGRNAGRRDCPRYGSAGLPDGNHSFQASQARRARASAHSFRTA